MGFITLAHKIFPLSFTIQLNLNLKFFNSFTCFMSKKSNFLFVEGTQFKCFRLNV